MASSHQNPTIPYGNQSHYSKRGYSEFNQVGRRPKKLPKTLRNHVLVKWDYTITITSIKLFQDTYIVPPRHTRSLRGKQWNSTCPPTTHDGNTMKISDTGVIVVQRYLLIPFVTAEGRTMEIIDQKRWMAAFHLLNVGSHLLHDSHFWFYFGFDCKFSAVGSHKRTTAFNYSLKCSIPQPQIVGLFLVSKQKIWIPKE